MLEDILTVTRLALLLAGVCAVAVWAARQHDQDSPLLKRLSNGRKKRADE